MQLLTLWISKIIDIKKIYNNDTTSYFFLFFFVIRNYSLPSDISVFAESLKKFASTSFVCEFLVISKFMVFDFSCTYLKKYFNNYFRLLRLAFLFYKRISSDSLIRFCNRVSYHIHFLELFISTILNLNRVNKIHVSVNVWKKILIHILPLFSFLDIQCTGAHELYSLDAIAKTGNQ